MIKGVKIEDKWCEEPRNVKEEIKDYFQNKYKEECNVQIRLHKVSFPCINQQDNEFLINNFSEEKVKDAVWDCDKSKSLGLDDLINCNFTQ